MKMSNVGMTLTESKTSEFEIRYAQPIKFLMENGSSIICYKILTELCDNSAPDTVQKYRSEVTCSERVNMLLACLKNRKEYHGATSYAVENSLNMLVDMGVVYNTGFSEFDKVLEEIADEVKMLYLPENDVFHIFYQILIVPFLYRAGLRQAWITDFIKNRINLIHEFTKLQNYDIYDDLLLHKLPAAYAGRSVIKPELYKNGDIQFPLEYDIYGFAAIFDDLAVDMKNKVNEIISYIMDDRFQVIQDGYGILYKGNNSYVSMGWDPKPVNLLERSKVNPLLRHLELLSHFKSAVQSQWFKQGIDIVNHYLDESGTYNLPKEYLTEKDSIWIMGNHMSLGENRRSKKAYVVEGTFHMLKILKQTEGAN